MVTVGRVDTTGIDAWPKRMPSRVSSVGRGSDQRDPDGQILLSRLITPHWGARPAVVSPTASAQTPSAADHRDRNPQPRARVGAIRGPHHAPSYAEELE
jgi:hypothetical protein